MMLPDIPADLKLSPEQFDWLNERIAQLAADRPPDTPEALLRIALAEQQAVQPKLVGLGIRDEKPPLCPTEPIPYNPPVRADRKYLCLVDSRVKVRMRSDGLIVKTRYSCNWCGPCLRWWRYTASATSTNGAPAASRSKPSWSFPGWPMMTWPAP